MEATHLLITICARGGSEGIPDKNIRPVNGIPLIGYSIAHAEDFADRHKADIALSTDDPRIREVCARFGLATDYVRPAHLATALSGKTETMQDVLSYTEKERGKRYDVVLDLDVTSPLRTQEDLERAFRILCDAPEALNVFSVNPARRNPYFNMVERTEEGFYDFSKKISPPPLSRQTAPEVYELNSSIYFYRRSYFESGITTHINSRSLIYRMPHVCFDLDDPVDFEFLEYLLTHNALDFPFTGPRETAKIQRIPVAP